MNHIYRPIGPNRWYCRGCLQQWEGKEPPEPAECPGRKDGTKNPHMNGPTSYEELRQAHAVPKGQPGKHLHAIIAAAFGQNAIPGCGCGSMMSRMNGWGLSGCKKRQEEIVSWLVNVATKESWTLQPEAGVDPDDIGKPVPQTLRTRFMRAAAQTVNAVTGDGPLRVACRSMVRLALWRAAREMPVASRPVEKVTESNIKGYFDRVVVVSMADRMELRKRFYNELSRRGWPFKMPEVFTGVPGRLLPTPQGWPTSAGAWGCMLSHQQILQHAIVDGVKRLLVLEDDAVLVPGFSERAREFLNLVPDDWDMLFLGGQHDDPPLAVLQGGLPPAYSGLVRCIRTERTHAYAVQGDFMRTLYRQWVSRMGHCDVVLQSLIPTHKVYAPRFFLAGQGEHVSDINSAKKRTEFWDRRPEGVDKPHKHVIIGLGSGRCGTKSLAVLLTAQKHALVTHEQRPVVPWTTHLTSPTRHIDALAGSAYQTIGDVGFYYLPHVETIWERYPQARFICLQRDREETIDSFVRWIKGVDYWAPDRDTKDPWTHCFPVTEGDNLRARIGAYYDAYYEHAEKLAKDERFLSLPMESLNTREGVTQILRHAGFTDHNVRVGIHEHWTIRPAVRQQPHAHGYWQTPDTSDHRHDPGLAKALADVLQGHSVIDLGCGDGFYVRELRAAKLEAVGVDGNPHTSKITNGLASVVDLTDREAAIETKDAALFLEVGEHIPDNHAKTVIANVSRAATQRLIVSWAPPGQRGVGHVNCRPREWVVVQMRREGWEPDEETSAMLRNAATLWWFKKNIIAFRRAS